MSGGKGGRVAEIVILLSTPPFAYRPTVNISLPPLFFSLLCLFSLFPCYDVVNVSLRVRQCSLIPALSADNSISPTVKKDRKKNGKKKRKTFAISKNILYRVKRLPYIGKNVHIAKRTHKDVESLTTILN